MISRACFRCNALATLLLATSFPLLAQQNTQTIVLIGEIKVARGSFPPRRVEVNLETRGATMGQTYSDDEGKFLFANLWPNVYYVIIKETDFEPVRQQVEVRALSGNTAFISITLIPRESGKIASPKDNHDSGGENSFIVDKSEFEKHYPKEAVKEFDKGNKAARGGSADEAARHFEKAVSLAPDFYKARNNLGLMQLAQQNFQAAEKQFREIVRLNPSDSQAYFNLGNTYLLTKRLDEAQQAIQGGLQRRPDSTFGQFLLATVYSRTGNREQAEQLLQHVLATDPAMSKAHLELVNLYLQENKSSEAMVELREFLKVSPEDAFAPKAREVLVRLEREAPPKP